MNKVLMSVVGFAAVLGVGGFLQQQNLADLRDEITVLRMDVQRISRQRDPTRRQEMRVGEVAAVNLENGATDEHQAELMKLRDEVAELKKTIQEASRFAQAARGESPIPVKLIPAGELKNAGRATVPAAVETFLWAAVGGDVEVVANSILLDPAAQAKAQELFARLPDAMQAQYRSPDNLVALMLAKDAAALSGMQVLGQRDLSADVVGVRVRLANDAGQTKEQGLAFQKTSGGLLLKISVNTVDKFAQQLSGGK